MSANSFFAKFLRFVGIVLMALTAGFTLLGGIGTTCAALFPTNWESMAPLASFQWLYILFVLTGIGIGIAGVRATVLLVKGSPTSYRDSLLALAAGVVIGIIHILTSRSLRGNSMPVDAVVYTSILTLIIFLLFRIPTIWQGVDFTHAKNSNTTAGGAAAIVLGIMCLTIQMWMGSTHSWGGINYADAFHTAMLVIGWGFVLIGGVSFLLPILNNVPKTRAVTDQVH